MTIKSYVYALETMQASLRLYDELLHDINFDISMTTIGNLTRLHLLGIRKLKVELEMTKIYNAIEEIEADFFVEKGVRYEY